MNDMMKSAPCHQTWTLRPSPLRGLKPSERATDADDPSPAKVVARLILENWAMVVSGGGL